MPVRPIEIGDIVVAYQDRVKVGRIAPVVSGKIYRVRSIYLDKGVHLADLVACPGHPAGAQKGMVRIPLSQLMRVDAMESDDVVEVHNRYRVVSGNGKPEKPRVYNDEVDRLRFFDSYRTTKIEKQVVTVHYGPWHNARHE